MKIIVTGATGVIGTALVPRLLRHGHQEIAWVRDEGRARNRLGQEVVLISARDEQALERAQRPLKVLLSARAIGHYPSSQAEMVEEEGPGTGFLSELCVAWEQAAMGAEGSATRMALIRIGIFLGYEGTTLQKMEAPIDEAFVPFSRRLPISASSPLRGRAFR